MQIEITFTCRECGKENTLHTDTSYYGVLEEAYNGDLERDVLIVDPATALGLGCPCGHISSELGLGYRYLSEHRPANEREEERSCQICGCTDADACFDDQTRRACHWVGPSLCSACATEEQLEAFMTQAAN